jgi:hypothetical protein
MVDARARFNGEVIILAALVKGLLILGNPAARDKTGARVDDTLGAVEVLFGRAHFRYRKLVDTLDEAGDGLGIGIFGALCYGVTLVTHTRAVLECFTIRAGVQYGCRRALIVCSLDGCMRHLISLFVAGVGDAASLLVKLV